ncbi:hypothetical protein [Streptomyces sp. SM12]|uniref:hypothetical protein n=1 Tax=Streptomyces sp. SM12 TaxID=1071602 RepID=UPI000CD4DF44|nr:hypothetical protein [Streptomyces sp. SM12]
MRGWFRRTAGTLTAALVVGLLAAPPARAEGQLDRAAEALAEPGVWADEDYRGLTEDMVALLDARYARAETPFRMALLTEKTDDADALARDLATRVGEPGVYFVLSEWDDPLSDYRDSARGFAATAVGATADDLRDENINRAGINTGNVLLTLPDSLDGDLSARLPRDFGEDRFLVDPAVTDVFPELTEELLRDTFADTPRLRVALVSGVGGASDAAATTMAADLPADGAMLLLQWEDSEFSVVMGSGRDLPSVGELESIGGSIGISRVEPELLPTRLTQLAAVLGPDVTELAREALDSSALYVHPAVQDGVTTGERLAEFGEAFAALDSGARVAVLPEAVTRAQLGEDVTGNGDDDAVARLVAGDDEGPLAVFLADMHYLRISDAEAVGGEEFVTAADRSRHSGEPFLETTLSRLLEQLGSSVAAPPATGEDVGAGTPGQDTAAGPALADSGALRLVVWVLLGLAAAATVLTVASARLLPRGRPRLVARSLATASRRKALSRMTERQRHEQLARSARTRAENGRELARLENRLAALPVGYGDRLPPGLGQLLGEYERLRAAHAEARTVDQAAQVRKDLARAHRRHGLLALVSSRSARPAR